MPTPDSQRTSSLLAFFAVASIGILIWSTSIEARPLLLLPVFAAWVLVPYGILWTASRWAKPRRPQLLFFLIGSMAVGFFGVGALFYGLLANPDPQGGLLLFFIPLWQIVGAGIVAGIGFLLRRGD